MTCEFDRNWGDEDGAPAVMLETCIIYVSGYREDQVFLVVPDTSVFGSCVPIILGTFTIGRVIMSSRRVKWMGFLPPGLLPN